MRMDANTWPAVAPTGPPAMGWMTGSGNISYMITNDPSAASFFFNTPNSFCTGASLTASPVPGHYATTAVLNLSSYTNPATDSSPGLAALLANGATSTVPYIQYGYKMIAYDNEVQASTPVAESNDPPTYMQDFINACHTNTPRYNVCCAPGYDLYTAAARANYPLLPGETQDQWFVRVVVGMGAAGLGAGDLFVLQNESLQNTATYETLWNNTVAKMAAVSPGALVFAEVSSQNATGSTGQALGSQMATNAQTLTSPYPDGFYVAMPPSVTNGQAGGRYFLDDMMAAGYSA